MAQVLSAHILAKTGSIGLDTIITLCPECFSSFIKLNVDFKEDNKFKKEINSLLSSTTGLNYKGGIKVKHLLQVICEDIGQKILSEHIVKRFKDLKAAVHVGCHFIRPSTNLYPDDPEQPKMLDELVNSLGVESIYWPLKLWCCGAPTLAFDRELSLDLAGKKLKSAKASGANCMVTLCPYCQIQFDLFQPIVEKKANERFKLPIILFTQLLGLCMGLSPKEVGLNMNKVSPNTVLKFLE